MVFGGGIGPVTAPGTVDDPLTAPRASVRLRHAGFLRDARHSAPRRSGPAGTKSRRPRPTCRRDQRVAGRAALARAGSARAHAACLRRRSGRHRRGRQRRRARAGTRERATDLPAGVRGGRGVVLRAEGSRGQDVRRSLFAGTGATPDRARRRPGAAGLRRAAARRRRPGADGQSPRPAHRPRDGRHDCVRAGRSRHSRTAVVHGVRAHAGGRCSGRAGRIAAADPRHVPAPGPDSGAQPGSRWPCRCRISPRMP